MKWLRIVSMFGSIYCALLAPGQAADYEGATVREVQVACVTAPEMVKLIQKNIVIQPGEPFSPAKIRASIRNIYALKGFVQITVEAEPVAGGVRLAFCPAQLKTISKVQITGHKALALAQIQRSLEINPGDRIAPTALPALRQRVLTLYRQQGYYHVESNVETIEEPGFEQVILTVDIQEGDPAKLGAMTFTGQTVLSADELVKISNLSPGARFSSDALEKGLARVKKSYAEKGYLGVDVTNQAVEYDAATDAIAVNVTLNEGKPTLIRFEGNVSASDKNLKALLKIFNSDSLREEILAENAAAVSSYYHERGFPFVNVAYRMTEENAVPVLSFSIDEGAQVRVQEITITGNHAFSAKQLRNLLFTDTKGLFSKGFYQEKVLQEDGLALTTFYQQNGYLEAEVVSVAKEFSPDQSQVVITLAVREGIRTQVADLHILGEADAAALQKIRQSLLLEKGDPLDIRKVSQSIERLKEFYASQGYIKVAVDVSTEFTSDNSQVALTFRIAPGKKFYIGKLAIEGVFRTKAVFITRELRVREGDVYNPAKIRETVRRLNQSGLYESVTFRRLDPKSDDPIQNMQLAVIETSAKDVKFGVGYSTERGLKGLVEYADKNVFNFGGKGAARAEVSLDQKTFGIAQPKLTLQYQQPHFFTQDTTLVAVLYDDIQKDNASFNIERRGGRLAVRRNVTDTFAASLGYYFEQADPTNVKATAQLSELDAQILNIAGVDMQLTWDRRDDVIQPRQGGLAQLYLRTANTALGAETNFFELNAQTNAYLPLWRNFLLAGALNGKLIQPTQGAAGIPIYNRYFLGGENTVRGFSKDGVGPAAADANGDQVYLGGDRLLRLNVELRFPIYSVLGGVIFFDAGANWLHADGFSSENIREAVGLGLRVATPVGPLRIDYGWKLDRRAGESAGDYYITIGSVF